MSNLVWTALLVAAAAFAIHVLRQWWRKPGKPELAVVLEGETDMLKYKVLLSEPKSPDVVERKLHVEVFTDTVEKRSEEISLPASAREFELIVDQDDNVDLWLVDIDDAGNESTESDILSFVARDTIPPGRPDAPVLDPHVEEV
jgi:aminopeptidase N